MKIIKPIITLFILLSLILNSCTKSDDNQTTPTNLSESPIAKPQFNNSNFGIYKGVFVGSSGIINVNLNNDNTISSTLIINGVTHNFTTNQTIQQGQATLVNFVNGSNSFSFSVGANGSSPTVSNININGHSDAAIIAAKETSTTIVKCYEGTYSGGETGIFNAITYGNIMLGLIKSSNNSIYTANGTVNNNQISATGNVSTGATFIGTLNGYNISGTWINSQFNLNGTWTGVRTY